MEPKLEPELDFPRSAMAVDKIQSAAAPLGPGASSEGGMDLSARRVNQGILSPQKF